MKRNVSTLLGMALCLVVLVTSVLTVRDRAKASPAVSAAPPVTGLVINGISNKVATDTAALYSQLSLLSTPDRKNFYASRSGLEKGRLWALHLTAYTLDRNVTPGQARLIQILLTAVKGVDLDKNEDAVLAAVKPLRNEIKTEFGEALAYELLKNLGGTSPFDSSQQPVFYRKANYGKPGVFANCTCAQNEDFCSTGTCSCAHSCSFTNSGCGWFWLEACTGICVEGSCPPAGG